MKLVSASVKRPVGVIMIVLAIVALGVVSVRNLAVDLFPEIELPVAVIATSYTDAAPEDVENLISRPIESAVSTVEGMDTIQSQSQPGSSLVVMMFKNGTDLDQAMLDVREKIDQVKDFLPDQAGDPNILRFSPDSLPVMYVGVTGKDAEALTEIANDQIVPFFERQGGVASVTVEGAVQREIQLELDPGKIKQYGVTSQEILQALNSTNSSTSVGTVDKGNQDLQLRVTGEFNSLDEINDTIITTQAGATIHVEDIAEVKDTFKDQTSKAFVNGENSIVLSMMKQTDANTVEVANNIRASFEELQGELGEEVQLDILIDTSEFIELSVDSVVQNIMIGGAIAIFILLLFLKSIRATLVIGLSIPIALIATFAMMYFSGQTLNVLTLGGLALGVGMMVDSSIVILEHIYSYRKNGHSLKGSAIKGATELAPAVIASTTTTLVVFLPMVFVDGIASDLFTPLGLAVSFSLIASLIVAITLVPMLSSKLLSKAMEEQGGRYWFDRFLNWLQDVYSKGLKKVLKWRKTTVAIVILAIIGSLALVPLIGAEFIPASDQGQAQITVETEPGTAITYTESIVQEVNKVLGDYGEVIETSYVTIGETAKNEATYTLQMVSANEREKSTTEIIQEMDNVLQDIAGAEIAAIALDGGFSMGDPIQIVLNGPEHEVLRELAEEVVAEISAVDGVFNPSSTASGGIPQMAISVDEEKAALYGLSEQQITSQIQVQFTGQTATRYRENGQELEVRLVYPEDKRSSISDLESMQVHTMTGATIPLEEVATFEEVQGPASLLRENQQPQMNVTSAIVDRDLAGIVTDIETKLDSMSFPEGYSYAVGGQAEDMRESFGQLALALIFSIFLVYAVMAVQFENFLYPFIIMFAMPTAVIGVIIGLFVMDISLNIPGFIGIIMLAGIVVNNSIILVDYINILRRRGMERKQALMEAGRSRLRPILMTTLTTVLAMIPLGLAIGEGAEIQQPLAVTIIFGLSFSTLFTLFFVPVVYTLLDDLSAKMTGRNKKKRA
ncbi:efflux RND transporter permease subunit [Oceanobacillus piezotolerans]|uniref:Efflux RND transporter permease subunit n=1 Tax=Oceanobacillus piezotolerans TaxID=2448030 RepID=A0A498DBS5_9BACI|nr:efflux RND transporter permease subunit [Oceanobacillus piezotolerans]RLL42937.1 efflux RND transporter permease subunit [Oceanobacillus piezotolerans]